VTMAEPSKLQLLRNSALAAELSMALQASELTNYIFKQRGKY